VLAADVIALAGWRHFRHDRCVDGCVRFGRSARGRHRRLRHLLRGDLARGRHCRLDAIP